MRRTLAVLGIAAALTAICGATRSAEVTALEDAPPYALPDLDHGLLQSPVNILTHDAVRGTHRLRFAPPARGLERVEHTGHSVQLSFAAGGYVRFDGRDSELLQLHFHTPSEHQIDGVTYPMEMHVVSRHDGEHGAPKYVVIGVLFKMGKPNAFIDQFIDRVPSDGGDWQALPPGSVNVADCFELEALNHHYHYRGSLTTPPYTEAVDWLVMEQAIEASPQQLARLNHIEGNNARHVQALFDRRIDHE
ncbi:MAG: carbonic anhydrase family protein [Myxococcales bacterium]|nr:carbonic anhydrase family protein [Myxococcales bacterium]